MNKLKAFLLEKKRPFIFLTTLGFLIYLPSLFFQFSYLDDNTLILDHYFFLKDLKNIFNAFKLDTFYNFLNQSYYRPVLTISFLLDAQISQQSAWGYHLTNIILHLVNTSLVFIFLKKMKIKKSLAFFMSLIFTTHPVLTQAVAWIPGRNDLLLTFFSLASFLSLDKLLKKKKDKNQKKGKQKNLLFFLSHLIFFLLAIFTKETALLLPLVFSSYLFINKQKKTTTGETVQILIITWILGTILFFISRALAFKNPMSWNVTEIGKSLLSSWPAVFLYLGKIILPLNLTVLPILKDTNIFISITGFLILTLLLITSKNKQLKTLTFGIFWFLIFLIPGFVRPNQEIIADFLEHRIYLSFSGFLIIISQIDLVKKFKPFRKKNLLLTIAIILVLATKTIFYSRNFKNRLSFWQKAVKGSPHHPLAHKNLGAMYYLDKNLEKAEEEFRLSQNLNPKETMIHNNLGLIYMDKKMYPQAEEEFKKEIEINPFYDTVYFNLGLLYQKQSQTQKALETWEKTVALNPNHLTAHTNLAILYLEQENKEKSTYHINQVIQRGGQLPSTLVEALNSNL